MKPWTFISLAFAAAPALAFVAPDALKSPTVEIKEALLANNSNAKPAAAKSALSQETLNKIFNDASNRIQADFNVPEFFDGDTRFWFSVYAQYDSNQVLLHDKNNLSLVYGAIDLSAVGSDSDPFVKRKLHSRLAQERARVIKNALSRLHLPKSKLSKDESTILQTIQNAIGNIPTSTDEKQAFFRNLSNNLRTQTGQRNMVLAGIQRARPFMAFLNQQFKNFKLPQELLAVAFVESTFSLNAYSRAGAAGVWQFMPRTANSFLPNSTEHIDYRRNPIISTLAALHLLKQNKQILKRWDLAIPAYNFGTPHLVQARRKFKEKATLAYILQNTERDSIGFASKNYYSSFLAMVRTLAYKDLIFPDFKQENKSAITENEIGVYVAKCPLEPRVFYSLLEKTSPQIKLLNSHFLSATSVASAPSIVISDRKLTNKRYYRVSAAELARTYPKNFYKLVKNPKCVR